jgi:hypothetical protein
LFKCYGTIQNNIIFGNLADETGGGLYGCYGTIQSNKITGNSAESQGGGLSSCDGILQNNNIIDNSAQFGGGLDRCDGTMLNNTISGNSSNYGGGLYGCSGEISNCIIWGNFALFNPQLEQCSLPTYSYIQDWEEGGEGNISGNRPFSYDGYHLMISLPCIDSGYDSGSPPVDIEGEARPQEMGVDIGADEYKDSDWDGLPD